MTVGSRGRTDPDGSRRRTLLVLALSTAIGSAGLAAGGTAGALLGADLAGNEAAAGLPLGLLVVGQAAAAVLVSRRTSRVGRGRSLTLCYVLGTSGAVLVVLAAAVGSLVAFLAGSVVLGAGNTAVCMTRYAAADAGGGLAGTGPGRGVLRHRPRRGCEPRSARPRRRPGPRGRAAAARGALPGCDLLPRGGRPAPVGRLESRHPAPRAGGRYLLYLMREGDSYTTSICSGSQPVGDSLPPELAEPLGKGTAPGIPQAMPQTGGPDVLSLAALTGLMASGIGVVVWRWAR